MGQYLEFDGLAHERGVGLAADHAAALFYVIAGYHGLHVLVGVVLLAGLVIVRPRPASAPTGAVQTVALYWQFVDVAWLVIFVLLYHLPSVTR